MTDARPHASSEDPFTAAVEAIYDAAPDPSRWPDALTAIANAFGDYGALLVYVREDRSFGYISSPALQDAHEEYLRNWAHRDLRASRSLERGFAAGGDTLTDADVVTPEEIESHPYYREFLARFGLKWFLGTGISPDPSVHVALVVQRRGSKPAFADAERERLSRLGRHAEKALRLSLRLIEGEIARDSLADALARLSVGVMLLDGLGCVTFTNTVAEGLVGDGLRVVNRKLIAEGEPDRGVLEEELQGIITGARIAADPRPILIHRREAERPLILYALPVRSSGRPEVDAFLAQSRAIVVIVDPRRDAPPDPAVVRDLLKLTLAEARIAALVGTGLAPRDAAARLGIAEETARSTLKRVFSKVGVSRQSELSALLSKLVLR